MQFTWKMPQRLVWYYQRELVLYRNYLKSGHHSQAWHHLERAHIIGQAFPLPHTHAHWLMLKFGFRMKDTKEVLGQLPRLFVGGIKSFVGEIPRGNTGGADVPPLRVMPLPKDIEEMFSK